MQPNDIRRIAIACALLSLGCRPLATGEDELGDTAGASDTSEGSSGESSTTASITSTDESSSTSDSSTSESSTSESSTSESSTSTETGSTDTSSTDTSDTSTSDTSGGETGNADCELNDVYEPNPSADQATPMAWTAASASSAYRIVDDAYLCSGEGDWYRFDVESLGYDVHFLLVRALIEDAGLCGLSCGDVVISEGPEHAMTIEVYRAIDMQLLASQTDDDGVLAFGGIGDQFGQDLLLHVFSPTPEAEYPYRLTVEMRNYDGEDECEC